MYNCVMSRQITGGVAVIEKDGKHFLIQQSKKKPFGGYWRHPGGSFEKNEKETEGISREIKEETNMDISVISQTPFHIEKDDYEPGYFGFYKAKLTGGIIKIDQNEVADFGFFTLEEIKKLKLMRATKSFYKKKYNLFLP